MESEETPAGVGVTGLCDGVELQVREAVAEVTLARPDVLNALNLTMWRRLHSVFQALSTRRDLRVAIIRGAGGRAFSAGADIGEFRTARLGSQAARVYNDAIAAALQAICALPVPVIAMIGGLAVGGGCEIATACDLRIAGQAATFGIPIMRLGVTLGTTEAAALVSLVGPAHAKDLLFTGRLIDADEALRMGLVNRVVPPEELENVVWSTAKQIGQGAPLGMAANKLTINGLVYGPGAVDEAQLHQLTCEVYDSSDLAEGIAAFEQKRDPLFRGR